MADWDIYLFIVIVNHVFHANVNIILLSYHAHTLLLLRLWILWLWSKMLRVIIIMTSIFTFVCPTGSFWLIGKMKESYNKGSVFNQRTKSFVFVISTPKWSKKYNPCYKIEADIKEWCTTGEWEEYLHIVAR